RSSGTLLPCTTLFRSSASLSALRGGRGQPALPSRIGLPPLHAARMACLEPQLGEDPGTDGLLDRRGRPTTHVQPNRGVVAAGELDRKSTRLNSSHVSI